MAVKSPSRREGWGGWGPDAVFWGAPKHSDDAPEIPVFVAEQLKGLDRQGRQPSVQALVQLVAFSGCFEGGILFSFLPCT